MYLWYNKNNGGAKMNWSLEEIYKGIDDENFKNDIDTYPKKINELNEWADINFSSDENAEEKISKYLMMKNELASMSRLHIFVNLSMSIDSENEALAKIFDRLNKYDTRLVIHEVLFKAYIRNKNIDNMNTDIINEHRFWLNETKKDAKYMLDENKEQMISIMKTTGSLMWLKQWEQITSTAEAEMDGKKCSLTEIRAKAYDKNPEVRRKAYYAEMKIYEEISKPCSFSLNAIKGEVINVSRLRGWKSPLEMSVSQSRFEIKAINAMFDSIRENKNVFENYFLKKAEILGLRNGLPFYDIFAPLTDEEPEFTYHQAQEFIINGFSKFSPDMGKFAENAFKNRWIDPFPKKGKIGGAFCQAVHSIKESRIMTNFSGRFTDVLTLGHELGHAYHDSKIYNLSQINSFYPMPLAETASTFCEIILTRAELESCSEKQRKGIIEKDISEAAQVIIDIYSRFLFEDEFFRSRKDGSLSVNEICSLMENAQKESYGKGLDENYLNKYMWVCKPHYYDAEFNYYNFPYAFGFMLAKGLYAQYEENGENFADRYSEFLSSTTTNSIYEAGKIMGIDITDKRFYDSVLKSVAEEIRMFIDM